MSFVRELTVKQTAALIGVAVSTLREHYSCELAMRSTARLRMEMRQLERLNDEAEKGNVAAERELARMLDQLRMRDAARSQASAPPAKPVPKLGKKAEAEQRAAEQRGLYEPPPAPHLVN